MNKIITVVLLNILLIFQVEASNFTLEDLQAGQREIKTMQDFIALENTLKASKVVDPVKANYYLGLLYLTTHSLDNGTKIYPDYDKALSFLEESLNEGNILAAYSVAMIFLKKQKVDQSIFVLHVTLNSFKPDTEEKRSSGAYLSVALASIVLDFKGEDKEALSLAILHLEKYIELRDIPSGDYLLSQLYLRSEEIEKANKMLTRACKNPKLPSEIKKICQTLRAQ